MCVHVCVFVCVCVRVCAFLSPPFLLLCAVGVCERERGRERERDRERVCVCVGRGKDLIHVDPAGLGVEGDIAHDVLPGKCHGAQL